MNIKKFILQEDKYSIPCKIFLPETAVEQVIVGVHGFAGDKESSVLEALADELSCHMCALICFDFPAHGESKAEDKFLRVDNCKSDLMAVCDYVKTTFPNKKYGIFATSFGGYISLLCAENLKDFKLILRAPAVTMAESFINKIIPVSEQEFLENGGAICGFERKMLVSADFYKDLLNNPTKIPNGPITIIHGTDDDIIPYAAVEALAKEYPNISLVTVNGADHRFKRAGELEFIVKTSSAEYIN